MSAKMWNLPNKSADLLLFLVKCFAMVASPVIALLVVSFNCGVYKDKPLQMNEVKKNKKHHGNQNIIYYRMSNSAEEDNFVPNLQFKISSQLQSETLQISTNILFTFVSFRMVI